MVFVYYGLIIVFVWSGFGVLVLSLRMVAWRLLLLAAFFFVLSCGLAALMWLNLNEQWLRGLFVFPFVLLALYRYFDRRAATSLQSKLRLQDIILWWRNLPSLGAKSGLKE